MWNDFNLVLHNLLGRFKGFLAPKLLKIVPGKSWKSIFIYVFRSIFRFSNEHVQELNFC